MVIEQSLNRHLTQKDFKEAEEIQLKDQIELNNLRYSSLLLILIIFILQLLVFYFFFFYPSAGVPMDSIQAPEVKFYQNFMYFLEIIFKKTNLPFPLHFSIQIN